MSADALVIGPEPPTRADVKALLQRHLDEMHRCSPACKVNSLPAERLAELDVTFFTARKGGNLVAVGALKELSSDTGELKSMRADDAFRGTGAGRAILRHLIGEARRRGYRWLGLETGKHEVFDPAQKLYASEGFAECPAFADYESDDFSMCMGMDL